MFGIVKSDSMSVGGWWTGSRWSPLSKEAKRYSSRSEAEWDMRGLRVRTVGTVYVQSLAIGGAPKGLRARGAA